MTQFELIGGILTTANLVMIINKDDTVITDAMITIRNLAKELRDLPTGCYDETRNGDK